MGTNLIQNYMINSAAVQSKSPQNNKPNFDINRELANHTFIKPLPSHGRLIRKNLSNAPIRFIKNISYNTKALKDSYNGSANDHQLGKVNDIGLLLGGLGIASYLATKKATPMAKGMEFVGLGSFLASMALWPKIAIQLPAKLIHGVNVQQEYIDNFGRRKPFYQDPQFIPWDLYSDKEINKIGNRLGVPKDIPNRREFIQERMRKLAVQNNTLWMLTAGVGTPVMSALMCNQLEPVVLKLQSNLRTKKYESMLNNFAIEVQKVKTDKLAKELDKILTTESNHIISDKLIDEIVNVYDRDFNIISQNSIRKDLKTLLMPDTPKFTLSENIFPEMEASLREAFVDDERLSKEVLDVLIPDKTEIKRFFESNGFVDKSFTKTEMDSVISKFHEFLIDRIDKHNETASNKGLSRITEFQDEIFFDKIFSKVEDGIPISKKLYMNPADKLDRNAKEKLAEVTKILDRFGAKKSVLDKYYHYKYSSAAEMSLPNYWNSVADELPKIFKFSFEELSQARLDREIMNKILRDKIERIASNDEEYKKVMDSLCQKIAKINEITDGGKISPKYLEHLNATYYETAKELEKLGMTEMAQTLVGLKGGTEQGSLLALEKAKVENRLLGVKSSFARLINTLDFYRRVAKLDNLQALNNLPLEVKEELVELCKTYTMQGHSCDFETKLDGFLRNPEASKDFGELTVKDGKVVNRFFRKHPKNSYANIPDDVEFYKRALGLVYECPYNSDTKEILSKYSLEKLVNSHRHDMAYDVGDSEYFAKPHHIFHDTPTHATSERKFLITGATPDEMMTKVAKKMFNTKKWFRIVGTIGATALALTVFIQFFLGKIKAPERSQK